MADITARTLGGDSAPTRRTTARFGWIPDLPDARDFLFAASPAVMTSLPTSVNLTSKMPPVYDQGQLGSCHDRDTEILTSNGWLPFPDLTVAHSVATVDPVTRELSYERPTRVVQMPYTGDLHTVKNSRHDFRVTPDHTMLVRKWNEAARTLESDFSFVPMAEVGWYAGLMETISFDGTASQVNYRIPGIPGYKRARQREDLVLPMKTWLRFLGIYLAEGTILNDHRGYKIQLAAAKDREKDFVRRLLADIGVVALELKDRFTFHSARIWRHLESLGLKGVYASEKFVPRFVFDLPGEDIAALLEGHREGDGACQRGAWTHYTTSPQLADDLQLLIFLAGGKVGFSIREPRTTLMTDGRRVVGRRPEYSVRHLTGSRSSLDRKKDVTIERYAGMVYCAEVPTHHTLVTRRNGRILISGNCTANALGGAFEYELKKQGLVDMMPSRLFIYYNERVIEGTTSSDSGAQIRDGIKTLAKQGVCPESEWPYDITKFARKPPKACYTDARKDLVASYQRVAQNLTQIKGCLADGYPVVIGFTVYESFESAAVAKSGVMPMPATGEKVLGGHAVLVVGYDDKPQRFRVRNSWGTGWGQKGYFTMPYGYLSDPGLSSDFWTLRLVA